MQAPFSSAAIIGWLNKDNMRLINHTRFPILFSPKVKEGGIPC